MRRPLRRRSRRLGLALASLFLFAAGLASAAGPELRWQGEGRQGRVLILADPAAGDQPVDLSLALPQTGDWRVSALSVDGRSVPVDGSVTLGLPGVFRRVRVGHLRFTPPARGWTRAELVLDFDAPLAPSTRSIAADPLLDGLVLNPAQAVTVAAPRAAEPRDRDDEIFDGSGHWIRLDVAATGIYRLDYGDLVSAGMIPGASLVDLRLLGTRGLAQPTRLEWPGGSWERGWQLPELPLLVRGGDSLAPETEILAYLPGVDGYRDEAVAGADFESYRRGAYAARAAYYLNWGGGSPGARVTSADAAPQGGETVLSTLPARVHRERNTEYNSHELFEDGWAWTYVFPGSGPTSIADNVGVGWPASGEPARLRIGFDADRHDGLSGPHHIQGYLTPASVQADPADPTHRFVDGSAFISSSLSQAVFEGTLPLPADLEGLSTLRFTLRLPRDPPTGLANDFGWLLWYELYYAARPRTANSAPLLLNVPDTQARAQVTSSGWAHLPDVWDLSDPAAPVLLTGGVWAGDSLALGLDTSSRRRLMLVDSQAASSYRTPDRVLSVSPTPLRHDARPHMVVIAFDGKLDAPGDDGFLGAANRFAAWRAAHFPAIGQGEIEVVGVSDIYANFGGGMQDPAALRHFLKYRFDTPESRLSYVLLLGDTSTDYRNFLGRDVRGDVSNVLVPSISDRFRIEQYPWAYTTDDFFAYMDAEDDSLRRAIPDLAMGRLPASDESTADVMIDAIIGYERDAVPGLWNDRMVIATDDYTKNCQEIDTIDHTAQAELLVRFAVPPVLDLQKIYMCEWDCDYAGFKPQAQNALFDALNEGVLVFNYVGHGGNDVLSDEQLLLTPRLSSLANGNRRFLFVSASCNVGKFDDTQGRSMSEEMLSLAAGGAIATMASSDLSSASFNNQLNRNFLQELFPDRLVRDPQAVGAALLRAKVRIQQVDYEQSQGFNNERYTVLGDPSLRLRTPQLTVEFDATRADTLEVGSTLAVSGRVLRDGLLAPDFNGELQLSVRASADTSGTMKPLYGGGTAHVAYHLPGPEVFRGRVRVTDGRFQSPAFFVPGLPDSALGNYGRIRAFAVDTDSGQEAAGALDSLTVLPGILPPAGDPPRVSLHLASGATHSTPGGGYAVEAEAASGINLVGAHPQNAIFVEFVETGEVDNLTDRFEYGVGSATAGSAEGVLPPGLPQGLNTLVASVADNLGNVGRDTLRVEIFEAGRADVLAVQPFPNPFRGRCAISFELTAPGHVSCDIYTVSGRRVRHLELDCPDAGRYALDWDGRDSVGDEVANGTYLYRLEAVYSDNAARRRERTGALVRMRE